MYLPVLVHPQVAVMSRADGISTCLGPLFGTPAVAVLAVLQCQSVPGF